MALILVGASRKTVERSQAETNSNAIAQTVEGAGLPIQIGDLNDFEEILIKRW